LPSFAAITISVHKNGVSILLILGRRTNQSIVFPSCGITVRLLDVNGRVAKIGIEAPRSVEIMRGELAVVSSGDPAGSVNTPSRSVPFASHSSADHDLPVLQFSQRLKHIKASLQLFQQHRAAGNELGADQVLGELLNEMAQLDSDWVKSELDSSRELAPSKSELVSESISPYSIARTSGPIQILVVNGTPNEKGLALPAGTFHGCQLCSVSGLANAFRAIESNERVDYVVCNGSSMAFDELELVRTIRSNHHLDATKIFMTSVEFNAKEYLELSNSYRIDGWLTRPLVLQDLWKHILESEQLEP
jgi:carbon storage regulator CsrA